MATQPLSTDGVGTKRAVGGWWRSGAQPLQFGDSAIRAAVHHVAKPVFLVDDRGRLGVASSGSAVLGDVGLSDSAGLPMVAHAPAMLPDDLGDAAFRREHGLKYAYIAGAMANGIASADIVESMSAAGMLGFFGAAGLPLGQINAAIDRIQRTVGDRPYGSNLIHTPGEPHAERDVVELYVKKGVHLISASAYLDLTLPLICYRVAGIHRTPAGEVVAPNRILAKVSRVELARKFFSPPPDEMLQKLVDNYVITKEQAVMAAGLPVACDVTAEADSGGHTDNRPAIALVPTLLAVAAELNQAYGYATALRVGAAGGIATPESVAAAVAMGAAYVVTGSVNQACVEAGTSQTVREMLAKATQADVTMAPAADMFEMGVKVQVLKWGTLFAVRARKLYDLYRTYAALEDIPAAQRVTLERDYFRATLAEAWSKTREFFTVRDPEQIVRAERDPKHRMALVFRSYLGRSSEWANSGEQSRKADYQIWCGPAMGAFNEWARGSILESPSNRDVVTVGMNLLVGAAAVTRASWLCSQGAALPSGARRFEPRDRTTLESLLARS